MKVSLIIKTAGEDVRVGTANLNADEFSQSRTPEHSVCYYDGTTLCERVNALQTDGNTNKPASLPNSSAG